MAAPKKSKRGRPPDNGAAATKMIKIRVTPETLSKYEAAAAKSGQSLSEWLRDSADRRL